MITRRSFLKTLITFFLSIYSLPFLSRKTFASMSVPSGDLPLLSVARGVDKGSLIQAALHCYGGLGKWVKQGSTVVIKPNAAWSRTPEEGANVHPELLTALINECFECGAKKVRLVEHSCDNHKSAFTISGIGDAVGKTKASLHALEKKDFVEVAVPQGKVLKKAFVAKDIMDADVYINMPIAKTHSSAKLTLSMKNHMGAVRDRWYFHRTDLHQCIADISTVLRPDLIIVDATRILLTNGPKGPGEVKEAHMVIAGVDQVAVDSYAATLFGLTGYDIRHIVEAHTLGVGEIDISKLNIPVTNL